MRIDKIYIRNFHGIEQAEYFLHPNATVLLGSNATGKSAILDSLAVLAGSYFLGIDGVNSVTINRPDIRQELRFEADGSTRLIYHTPCLLSAEGEVHGEHVIWARERQSLAGKTRQADAKSVSSLARKNHAAIIGGGAVTRPFLGYYSVARLGAGKKETQNQKQAQNNLHAGYMNALTAESGHWAAERWFAGLQSRAQGRLRDAATVLELSKATIRSLFRGVDRPLVDFRHDPETDELYVLLEGASGFIPASFLSSGFKSIFSMGLDICHRMYALNPHLLGGVYAETPGLALIDETDMHLHPKWQGRIIDSLREAFPSLQFVFTTHSPFIVQSLRDARIIDLDENQSRDVGGYVKKSIPEVAEQYMGMEDIERSPYFSDQVRVAEEYFTLLRSLPRGDASKLAEVKKKLDQFEVRYDRDPAFIGLLRAERRTSGVDEC